MLETRIHRSIDEIDAGEWNACFRDGVEDHACLSAIEAAGLDRFAWFYLVVVDGAELVATAAGFVTDYPLDTTLSGIARRSVARLRQVFPRLLAPRLACIGSPCTETAPIGFAAHLDSAERRAAGSAVAAAFAAFAAEQDCALLGYKDIAEYDRALWAELLAPADFQSIPGLPVAWLPIDFDSIEEYLARLSSATRQDMRRKLRHAAAIRIEHRSSIDDVLDRVMRLYAETRARADMQFETLTPEYFTGMLARMPGRAFCTLYWLDDDLLAANLLIHDGGLLLDKFFCMDAERGRAANLYFLSWFANLRYCLDHGLARYQAGQAAYANKLRLGSRLTHTAMYFRHRNMVCNRALGLAAPLLAADAAPQREAA